MQRLSQRKCEPILEKNSPRSTKALNKLLIIIKNPKQIQHMQHNDWQEQRATGLGACTTVSKELAESLARMAVSVTQALRPEVEDYDHRRTSLSAPVHSQYASSPNPIAIKTPANPWRPVYICRVCKKTCEIIGTRFSTIYCVVCRRVIFLRMFGCNLPKQAADDIANNEFDVMRHIYIYKRCSCRRGSTY